MNCNAHVRDFVFKLQKSTLTKFQNLTAWSWKRIWCNSKIPISCSYNFVHFSYGSGLSAPCFWNSVPFYTSTTPSPQIIKLKFQCIYKSWQSLLLSYTNIVKVPTDLLDVHLSLKGNPASSEPPSFRLGISNGNSKETRIPFAHLKC